MKNDLIFLVCIVSMLVAVKLIDKWAIGEKSKKKIEEDDRKWEKMPLDEFEEAFNKN